MATKSYWGHIGADMAGHVSAMSTTRAGKNLFRILGYAWIACLGAVLLVTAGVDWLADLRPDGHFDLSRWTYFKEAAGVVPGIVMLLLGRWL